MSVETSLPNIAALEVIQQRLLWLAIRMVDHANRDRDPAETGGIKIGGHQASSASMVSIMTSLWFGHINGNDKVAVKPHASPVYHAIKYLTGELDRSYLTTLRRKGGLQAYPSRTKDPDVADFSTGSVGLGAVAPLFAAAARRYVDAHFGPRDNTRFIALVGDAELDEGNIWEAIADPALQGLGNVMWIVDANRQSLDRVIPDMKLKKLMKFFEDSGWHVVEAKYGARLSRAFRERGGKALRALIDQMSNEEYQSLFAFQGAPLRDRLYGSPAMTGEAKAYLEKISDDELAGLVQNLGGHDLRVLIDAYRQCDEVTDRPSVVFAYTVKGWGLPIAGDPLNHSALLTPAQIDDLRSRSGLDTASEWDRFADFSTEGTICRSVGGSINNTPSAPRPVLSVPIETSVVTAKNVSTQETFGRVLTSLANVEGVRERLVTTSPDVSVSTNLGGWVNKMGVFTATEQPDFLGDDRLLKWKQGTAGQHIELGISEMNLFLLLHALGLGNELHGEHLLPIGTVYDPFVCRGLDALIYALYSGAKFVVVGTPSGITLSPEGGAHQSTITASIGLELPGLTLAEPAYAIALDWLLCDGLAGLSDPDRDSLYLRLSTRPLDQAPFAAAMERFGKDRMRADVLAGGYVLRAPSPSTVSDEYPAVTLMASGAVIPEVLRAAELLEDEGVSPTVVDVTSLDRLYRGWRNATRLRAQLGGHHAFHLQSLITESNRRAPIVTVHDAASHAMAWMGSVFGARVVPVGVDSFGQSGTIPELYETFGLLPEQLVNAALSAL
jgi:pyruvate dehydrogenase E1 component